MSMSDVMREWLRLVNTPRVSKDAVVQYHNLHKEQLIREIQEVYSSEEAEAAFLAETELIKAAVSGGAQ